MKSEETGLDEQSMKTILVDMLEQDGKTQTFMEQLQEKLDEKDKQINALISGFELKFKAIKIDAPKPDLSQVTAIMDKGFKNIHAILEKRPKPINRQFRFPLFPENNPERYYKMVFGRLIPVVLAFIVLMSLCNMGEKIIDAYQARQHNIEGDACISAWNAIYAQAGKSQKKEMTKALNKAHSEQ